MAPVRHFGLFTSLGVMLALALSFTLVPALAAMMASAGRAIRWNAGVLACGLCVLGLSDLKPNRCLGILLAAAIVTCYGTTLLLVPRLLERWEERSRQTVGHRLAAGAGQPEIAG